LEKIKGLLRRLSTEANVAIELASLDDSWANSSGSSAGRRFWRRKRFWVGSFVSASIIGAGAGAYWWTTIARLLGIESE